MSERGAMEDTSRTGAAAQARMRSPFAYPGGKSYALRHILPAIPDHDCYVEPFCGGGSVYFAKPKALSSWLNDIDAELINCHRCIRDRPRQMAGMLASEAITRERHARYRQSRPWSDLGRAVRYYWLNRTSFSGIMRPDNCNFRFYAGRHMPPSGWCRRIAQCSAKMQGTMLTHLDFEEVIDGAPDGSFLFVDPPYHSTWQRRLYAHPFGAADHGRLRDALRRNAGRLRFLLTYDDHPDVRAMYGGWTCTDNRSWSYRIGRTDDQRAGVGLRDDFSGKRSRTAELFIRNYRI